jgi:hypothetical protein
MRLDGELAPVRVTVSVGIADVRTSGCAEALLRDADQALLEAKRLGRNRVVVCRESQARCAHAPGASQRVRRAASSREAGPCSSLCQQQEEGVEIDPGLSQRHS